MLFTVVLFSATYSVLLLNLNNNLTWYRVTSPRLQIRKTVSEKVDYTQPESREVDSVLQLLNHSVSPLWRWISILTFSGPVIEVLEPLMLKLCRIYFILLTDITLSNHIYWWPLFSRVTQTLCHSHPLCVINTNQVNFIKVFEDLGLLCFLLEAASFLLKKCTLWEAFIVFFFLGPAKRQNLKALLSQCGRPCHFQHCRLILQPPPKHLSGDVTSLWNYTGWFKNRRQGFPPQRMLSGCPLLPPFFCTIRAFLSLKKKKKKCCA